jgi:hypothetical protein
MKLLLGGKSNGILVAVACIATLLCSGCSTVDGSGNIEHRKNLVPSFEKVDIDLSADVEIRSGKRHSVSITTDDNIFKYIRTQVRDDTLYISKKGGTPINPTRLDIDIITPTLSGLGLDGNTDVLVEDEFHPEHLHISIDGSGSVEMLEPINTTSMSINIDGAGVVYATVEAESIETGVDGSADISLRGEADRHSILVDGSANVHVFDLETKHVEIDIDGSAHCNVHATDSLDVWIDGNGSVVYKGSPVVNENIDGSGSVAPL